MKTGLNFYTTNIINSADQIDADSKRINNLKFNEEFTYSYIKRPYKDVEYATVKLDTTNANESGKYYRIDMYIIFDGAEPFIGATPRDYYKGIPFWVEYAGGTSTENIVKAIEKNKVFVMDSPLVEAKKEGDTTITFTAKQEFIRFKKIEIVEFDAASDQTKVVVSGDTKEVKGSNGFGTYSYLIKNVTLPTAANTSWTSKTTMPIVGAKYDQYVVTMVAPAANGSMQHVGGRSESETTHVFWVNQAISKFEEDLEKILNPSTEANTELDN